MAVEHATVDARDLSHDRVGTEDLLPALLRDQEGLPAAILAGLGIEPGEVREAVRKI
jgi:ATP-dependent Clp protease ATP-binding subunit ClpA